MNQSVELVAVTQPRIADVSPETFTAYIARIGKIKSNPERLLRYLMSHAHWSPFEHTFVTFKIVTSRAIGRELLRHRSFTFQELSQRYEVVPTTISIELRKQSEKNRQSSTDTFDPLIDDFITHEPMPASRVIEQLLTHIQTVYQQLLNVGIARECARFILPECATTTILMTGSLRSWIHFFAVRDHEDAQKEARILAQQIKEIFIDEFPTIAQSAFTVTTQPSRFTPTEQIKSQTLS